MLHEIFTFLKFFSKDTSQQDVDRYIASKAPTSPGEVDYWLRQYEFVKSNKGWL